MGRYLINKRSVLSCLFFVGLTASMGSAAQADSVLALTAAGATEFTLSRFANGFPTVDNVGPLGIGFTSSGGVLVSDYPGNVRIFSTHNDGQSAAAAALGQFFGFNAALGVANSGGNIYMVNRAASTIVQLNNDGTFNHTVTSGLNVTGIATNPVNGNLFVSGTNGSIYSVNPTTGVVTTVVASVGSGIGDGLAVNATGTTVYVAITTGHILGFNTTTGAVVFDSGFIAGGPDGIAIGTFGALAGQLFVNTNGGTVVQIDSNTLVQTLIATVAHAGISSQLIH